MSKFGIWTKTTDSLPPEPKERGDSETYLCTIRNSQVMALRYKKTVLRNKIVIRWEYFDRISPWEVIAWMPFPEAFTE